VLTFCNYIQLSIIRVITGNVELFWLFEEPTLLICPLR